MKNKIIITILISFLLLWSSSFSATTTWIPSGYKSWTDKSNSSRNKSLLGGPVQHYRDNDSIWRKIENNWINHADTLFSVSNSVLKSNVFPNGKSSVSIKIKNHEVKIIQKMVRLVLLHKNTGNWITIDSTIINSTPMNKNNTLTWKNYFQGVDLSIIKENGRLQHRIYFTPPFLSKIVKSYQAIVNKEQYCLGNVIEYTFNNTDSILSRADKNQRIFKKIGRESFKLSSQQLFYKGWDSLKTIYVKQKWIKQNNKVYCIEYLPMQAIESIYLTNKQDTIWHNDSQEFDYTDCQDSYIKSDFADRNQGLNSLIYPIVGMTTQYGGFIKFDLSSIPTNAQIDSSWLRFQFTTFYKTHNLCRMLTNWDEGTEVSDDINNAGEHGVTYNYAKDDFSSSNWNWANDTNFTASDYDDNNGNYYGQVASTGSQLLDTLFVGTPQSGNMSDLIQKWIDGTYPNYGFGLKASSTNALIRSSEVVIVNMRPMMYVEWTVPPTQNNNYRRRNLSSIRK